MDCNDLPNIDRQLDLCISSYDQRKVVNNDIEITKGLFSSGLLSYGLFTKIQDGNKDKLLIIGMETMSVPYLWCETDLRTLQFGVWNDFCNE